MIDLMPPTIIPDINQTRYENVIIETKKPPMDTGNLFINLSSITKKDDSKNDFEYIIGLGNNLTLQNPSQYIQEVIPMNLTDKKVLLEMINELSEKDKEDFYQELLDSAYRSVDSGSTKHIHDTLKAWGESAEIYADSELSGKLKKAEIEFERGEGIEWNPQDFE